MPLPLNSSPHNKWRPQKFIRLQNSVVTSTVLWCLNNLKENTLNTFFKIVLALLDPLPFLCWQQQQKKCTVWELQVKFICGKMRTAFQITLRNCSKEAGSSCGEVSIYEILVKGRYRQSSIYFFRQVSASHEEQSSLWRILVLWGDTNKNWTHTISSWDFPGGAEDKNLPAKAGDTDSIPGLGRFHVLQSN